MDYLAIWKENVIARPSFTLRHPMVIESIREANLGPRWEYAKLKLRAEPCDRFEVVVELGEKEAHLAEYGYIEAAILGLLDSLLLAAQSPLKNVRVTLIEMEEHEVDSSQNSFRMAGREAGRKLLEEAIGQKLQRY